MAKKKERKNPRFAAKIRQEKDGKVKEVQQQFEIIWPAVIVPGHGQFTAEQLVDEKNAAAQKALAELVKRRSKALSVVSTDVKYLDDEGAGVDDESKEAQEKLESVQADLAAAQDELQAVNTALEDGKKSLEAIAAEVKAHQDKITELVGLEEKKAAADKAAKTAKQ